MTESKSSITPSTTHTNPPFFLVEFRFVASFLVNNADLSTFVFDSVQAAKTQRKHN